MFEDLLLPWQQIYHFAFLFNFLEQPLKFLVNFTLLKYVKCQRSYRFLITKELSFSFQILDLKDHFSASLKSKMILFGLYQAKHYKFIALKVLTGTKTVPSPPQNEKWNTGHSKVFSFQYIVF